MLVKSSKQEIRKHCGMPDLLQMVNLFFVVDWRPHMVMVIYHTWFFGDFLGFVGWRVDSARTWQERLGSSSVSKRTRPKSFLPRWSCVAARWYDSIWLCCFPRIWGTVNHILFVTSDIHGLYIYIYIHIIIVASFSKKNITWDFRLDFTGTFCSGPLVSDN